MAAGSVACDMPIPRRSATSASVRWDMGSARTTASARTASCPARAGRRGSGTLAPGESSRARRRRATWYCPAPNARISSSASSTGSSQDGGYISGATPRPERIRGCPTALVRSAAIGRHPAVAFPDAQLFPNPLHRAVGPMPRCGVMRRHQTSRTIALRSAQKSRPRRKGLSESGLRKPPDLARGSASEVTSRCSNLRPPPRTRRHLRWPEHTCHGVISARSAASTTVPLKPALASVTHSSSVPGKGGGTMCVRTNVLTLAAVAVAAASSMLEW